MVHHQLKQPADEHELWLAFVEAGDSLEPSAESKIPVWQAPHLHQEICEGRSPNEQ